MPKSPAARRYLRRAAVASAVYVLTVFLAMHIFHHGRLALAAAIGLALFPSIPIVAIIVIVGVYLKEEKDEFQRELYIRSLLWAAGTTLSITSFWSFLYIFGRHVAPVDGFHVLVIFWISAGLFSYALHRHYGGSSE